MTPLKLFPNRMTVIKISTHMDYSKFLGEKVFPDGHRELIGRPIYRVIVLPKANVKRVRIKRSKDCH